MSDSPPPEKQNPGYVIVDVEVTEPEEYKRYIELAPPSIATYEGVYLARGGTTANMEGDWQPNRLVILKFPSFQRALDWHNSDEYREARTLRNRTANSQMVAVEGLPENL